MKPLLRDPYVIACLAVATLLMAHTGGFLKVDVTVLPFVLVAVAITGGLVGRRSLSQPDQNAVMGVAIFASVWTAMAWPGGLLWREFALAGTAIAFIAGYVVIRMAPTASRRSAGDGLIALSAFHAVISLVGFASGNARFALVVDGTKRLSGPFAYPNAVGLFAALGLIVCVGSRHRNTWWVRVAMVLNVAMIVGSASRGGMLAAIVGVFALANRKAARTLLSPVVIGTAVIAVAALAFSGALDHRLDDASTKDRAAEWTAAVRLGMENPVKGGGTDKFLVLHNFRGTSIAQYAHNEPLQVFAGAGLIGLAALGAAAFYLQRAYAARGPSPIARAVLVAFVVGGLVDFSWHFAAITVFAGMAFALDD